MASTTATSGILDQSSRDLKGAEDQFPSSARARRYFAALGVLFATGITLPVLVALSYFTTNSVVLAIVIASLVLIVASLVAASVLYGDMAKSTFPNLNEVFAFWRLFSKATFREAAIDIGLNIRRAELVRKVLLIAVLCTWLTLGIVSIVNNP